jgi:hypothetical protein
VPQLPAVSPERNATDTDTDDPRHRDPVRTKAHRLAPLPTLEPPAARRTLELHALPLVAGAVIAVLLALVISSAL